MSKLVPVPVGTKFGRLAVTRELQPTYRNNKMIRRFLCLCKCGVSTTVILGELRRKRSPVRSCGCLQIDKVTKHGLRDHPLYPTYRDMHRRCYDLKCEDYVNYGGRGIKVCSEWKNDGSYKGLHKFILDMHPRPSGTTLDRKDNNKSYSKENCRWATAVEQAGNKSTNFLVLYKGKLIPFVKLWRQSERKVAYSTAYERVKKLGWQPIFAITETARRSSKYP